MRIIVVGSPRWSGLAAHYRVTDLLRAFQEVSDLLREPLVVVHRDHPEGVDHTVDRWARINGIAQQVFNLKRFHYGTAAEDVRDRLMIEAGADLILAFVMPEEDTDEWELYDRAKVAGIPFKVIRWDEEWVLPEMVSQKAASLLANPDSGTTRVRPGRPQRHSDA